MRKPPLTLVLSPLGPSGGCLFRLVRLRGSATSAQPGDGGSGYNTRSLIPPPSRSVLPGGLCVWNRPQVCGPSSDFNCPPASCRWWVGHGCQKPGTAHAGLLCHPDRHDPDTRSVRRVPLVSSVVAAAPRESSARVRATVGVVSATFGTVSYFALYSFHPPCQSNSRCLFPASLGTLLLLSHGGWGGGGGRDAVAGKAPQRQPQTRSDRRLEEVAKAVGGGYCRLQMPLKLALGVRETVAGRRMGALEGGGWVPPPPFQCIPGGGVGAVPGPGPGIQALASALAPSLSGEWYLAHLCSRPIMPQQRCMLGRYAAAPCSQTT